LKSIDALCEGVGMRAARLTGVNGGTGTRK
jgi:hypothetical protein